MKTISLFIFFLFSFFGLLAFNAGAGDGQVFKGHYIYGHEANSFRPCNKKEAFWVTGSIKILHQMEKDYKKYSKEPYGEVYAEFNGKLIGKATDGFAADYDGQLLVKRVMNIREKTDKDCKN